MSDLFCCGCNKKVQARLTDGSEIYPHRKDLYELPFWKCDICENYVGCHHKTEDRTRPLGCIPTKEITNARKHIHALLDPIWEQGDITRKELYGLLTIRFGRQYHTANIRSIEEAREVYSAIKEIIINLKSKKPTYKMGSKV